jgi:hypothetical protein
MLRALTPPVFEVFVVKSGWPSTTSAGWKFLVRNVSLPHRYVPISRALVPV